jgi:signal peptidase
MSDAKVKKKEKQTEKQSGGHKALTIVGIVLCVILVPILIVNLTMIVKGLVNKEKVPTFGGYAPLIVLTDSMSPTIKAGDLIVVKSVDASKVKEGDVISFFDPASSGTAVVTHRVLKQNKTEEDNLPAWHNMDNLPGIEGSGENLIFRTQGDFNNAADEDPVPASKLVGVWTGINLKGAGNVAMFLQSTPGLILCIGVPIVILVAYELIRRKLYERSKRQDTDELLKELEALKQAQKTQEIGNVSVVDNSNAVSAEKTAAAVAENAGTTAESEAAKAQARAEELQAQLAALQAQLAQAKQQARENNSTTGSDNTDGQTN